MLSEASLSSEWVATEIRKAREAELRVNRQKLFPIRLVAFDMIKHSECIHDTGKDLGVEIREYFSPDFSNWKDQDAFEAAFARLLKDPKPRSQPALSRSEPSNCFWLGITHRITALPPLPSPG